MPGWRRTSVFAASFSPARSYRVSCSAYPTPAFSGCATSSTTRATSPLTRRSRCCSTPTPALATPSTCTTACRKSFAAASQRSTSRTRKRRRNRRPAAAGAAFRCDEAAGKIRAAVAARDAIDPSFVICARCDSIGVEPDFDDTIARCVAYAKAGADLVWLNAVERREQLARVCAAAAAPVLCNWFSKVEPPPSFDELSQARCARRALSGHGGAGRPAGCMGADERLQGRVARRRSPTGTSVRPKVRSGSPITSPSPGTRTCARSKKASCRSSERRDYRRAISFAQFCTAPSTGENICPKSIAVGSNELRLRAGQAMPSLRWHSGLRLSPAYRMPVVVPAGRATLVISGHPMQISDGIIPAIGNTPADQAQACIRGDRLPDPGQGRVHESGPIGQGPRRPVHHRGRGTQGPAAPRRRHRRRAPPATPVSAWRWLAMRSAFAA